jgi:hypothetical protein|tara:strand:+ start:187 stop:954 length:768 start_codon:yes stop_codon:yes gene_type:complete
MLVLCVIALIVDVPSGNVIREYVSFAAAIASIVLALVAIIYSFIANKDFSDLTSRLHKSSMDVEAGVSKLSDLFDRVVLRTDEIHASVSDQKKTLVNLEERLNEGLSEPYSTDPTLPSGDSAVGFEKLWGEGNVALGGVLTFYAIYASYHSKNVIDSKLMLKSAAAVNFSNGFLYGLSIHTFCGIRIERADHGDVSIYHCTDLGAFDWDYFINVVRETIDEEENKLVRGEIGHMNKFFEVDFVQVRDSEPTEVDN